MPHALDIDLPSRPPTADEPLRGQTVLLVEDSRYASEAIRLMSLRSGARLRRADSLRSAMRHLRSYRPSVAVIDLGLPDGSGLELIADLAASTPRPGAILAISGDDGAEAAARAAGADAVLLKPITSLAAFQEAVLDALGEASRPPGPRALPEGSVDPDTLALRDDLEQAATLLRGTGGARKMAYAAQFLAALGRTANDTALEAAARDLTRRHRAGESLEETLAAALALVERRLSGKNQV